MFVSNIRVVKNIVYFASTTKSKNQTQNCVLYHVMYTMSLEQKLVVPQTETFWNLVLFVSTKKIFAFVKDSLSLLCSISVKKTDYYILQFSIHFSVRQSLSIPTRFSKIYVLLKAKTQSAIFILGVLVHWFPQGF